MRQLWKTSLQPFPGVEGGTSIRTSAILALTLLLALAIDGAVLGIAAILPSRLEAVPVIAGGCVMAMVLLSSDRYRAVGRGMLLWGALAFLVEAILYSTGGWK